MNLGKYEKSNWNEREAKNILNKYIRALEFANYNENEILKDLEVDVKEELKNAKNWTSWRDLMLDRIKQLFYKQWFSISSIKDSRVSFINININNIYFQIGRASCREMG